MKCKNCGQPIRKADFNDYLIHDRPGPGRIFCFPEADAYSDSYTDQAEPEESNG